MGTERLFDLSSRIALITGGNRGLGRAIARGIAQSGANIVICSEQEKGMAQSLEEILDGTGQKGCYFVSDLSSRKETEGLARRALEKMGRVDILVNNAGATVISSIDQVRDEDWDYVMEVNLNAAMALTRAFVPGMKARRWGRIVHISSVLGLGGKEGRNVYCASKAGLIGMARASALDLGSFGITVNCVAPGPFLTDMPASVLGAEQRELFTQRTALKRWGQPDEIVGPLLLLVSEAGSYITGTTLIVDGGVMAHTL